MNSKRYKLAVLIEIVLFLILATTFYLNPSWSAKNPFQIKSIHPNEFYIALSLLFFIVPISFLLAGGVTRFFKSKTTTEQSGVPKNTKQSSFWKYSFYSSFYFSFGLLVFSIFTRFTSDHPVLIYNSDSFIQNVFLFTLGIILISFFIGALFHGATILRKNNKASAFILTIVIFLLFISPFFAVSKYHQYCENTKPGVVLDSMAQEFTFFEEEGEGEGEYEDGEISFAHLWDDASQDEKNVSGALEEFFLQLFDAYPPIEEGIEPEPIKGRGDLAKMNTVLLDVLPESTEIIQLIKFSPSYTSEDLEEDWIEDEKNKDTYGLAKIIAEAREQPENAASYFERYKPLLYTLIDKKIYEKSSLDRTLKLLLITYQDLKSSKITADDKDKLYRKYAYNESLGRKDSDYEGPATRLEKIDVYTSKAARDKIIATLGTDSSDYWEYENVISWAYTFWIRRHYDGNEEQVFDILTEIDEHYSAEK